jgi:GNAT superfamily N-acetyltransferase
MRMKIRPAAGADLDAVVELATDLFAEDAGQRDPYTDLDWPKREGHPYYSRIIQDSATSCFLAEVDGVLAGQLVARIKRESSLRPVRVAELESMFVRPEYRSQGVGAALVAEFFGWARKQRAERAAVTAFAGNDRAVQFYERNGFEPRSLSFERPI